MDWTESLSGCCLKKKAEQPGGPLQPTFHRERWQDDDTCTFRSDFIICTKSCFYFLFLYFINFFFQNNKDNTVNVRLFLTMIGKPTWRQVLR